MNADFDRKVISIAKLVVADDRHKGAQYLERPVEIDARLERIGESDLGIPAKLEGAAAIVALDIERTGIIVIHVELLPDGTNSAADKRPELYLSGPAEDGIDLHGHLHEFSVG